MSRNSDLFGRMRSLMLLGVGIFSFAIAMGQDKVGVYAHYGTMIPHRQEITNLITGHAWGLEANIAWRSKERKSWETQYLYPDRGIDIHFTDMGNPDELGYQFSIAPYIDLPLSYEIKKVNQYLKLGLGLGHATKQWDLEDNVKSLVIGSTLNLAFHIQYAAEYSIKDNLHARFGLRVSHFSNGSFKLPNLGTNNLTLFTGLSFGKGREVIEKYDGFIGEDPQMFANLFFLQYEVGFRENFPPGGPKFAVHTIRNMWKRRFTNKSSYGAHLDLTFNKSLVPLLARDGEVST
ncbi:MAG: acyloxyacyl hydrolase, partial [Flavobacteriales bacterium]|nr:acyloxyacyl hydrolase [Flavobacteriales bacterium]